MSFDSNPILDFANNYEFPEYSDQDGFHKVVAFGDESHKCPIYVKQVPPCTQAALQVKTSAAFTIC